MKLDSIIYDIDTLQSALTEKTVAESQTFKALYPSDTATSLMTVLAGYGSMLQYGLVSAMANAYTDTVYSEAGIYQLAETLGNRLHGNVSSQISIYVKRNNLTGVHNVTIPANCVWDADGIKFYNPTSITFNNDDERPATLIQGEAKTYKTSISGVANERVYFSQDFKCDMNTVKVFVNGEEWSTDETFLPLNSNNLIDNTEMQSVVLRTDPDGRSYIKFGNNTTGLLPVSGSIVEIQYVSNDGSEGNIASDSIDITLVTPVYHYYEGNSTLLDVECRNTTVAAGGYNTQSLDVLKETSPYIFASGNRAINREDYKALLINKCGYITANVWGEYEESIFNGYYDKSMMNTVYYTGVKQLQHYDYKPLGEVTNLNLSGDALLNDPYNFSTNIGTIKGFPGSYSVDFIYTLDTNKKMRYRDKFGTGILTCDPSVNENNDTLYPFNDIGLSLVNKENTRSKIVFNRINAEDYPSDESGEFHPDEINARIQKNVSNKFLDQYFSTSDPLSPYRKWTGNISTIFKYNTVANEPNEAINDEDVEDANNEFTFIWDGFNKENRAKTIDFTNPVRIYFTFDSTTPTPISAVSFRAPMMADLLKYCPGKFAMFGTNEGSDVAPIDHVRNNINWKRVIDVNKIEYNVTTSNHSWTDWFTTKLYQPNVTLTDDQINNEVTVLFDKWQSYKRYVIEFYSLQDETIQTPGQFMIIPGIKMLYANNNEDYYAWVSSVYENEVDPRKDFEPDTVYVLSSSIDENNANQYQILVKTDGEDYPKSSFNPTDPIYHIKSVTNVGSSANYQVGDTFTITSPLTTETENKDAIISVEEINNTTWSVNDATVVIEEGALGSGSNYAVGDQIQIMGNTGDLSAILEVSRVAVGGQVTELSVLRSGTYAELEVINREIPADKISYIGTGTGIIIRCTAQSSTGTIKKLTITNPGEFATNIAGTYEEGSYIQDSEQGSGAALQIITSFNQDRYTYAKDQNVYDIESNRLYSKLAKQSYDPETDSWSNPIVEDDRRRYFRVSTISENLNIHKEKGVSLIDYENNDKINMHIPAFPEDIKYYSYEVEVIGAGASNNYRTGDRLYYEVQTADGSGSSYFHVIIQNANGNNGNGQCVVYYSKSLDSTVTNLKLADNILIDDTFNLQYNPLITDGSGTGAQIKISSVPAIKIYANLTGNSYTLSQTQGIDNPVIDKYNHFTTYLEFKQPRIKQVNVNLNVEYEENINTSQVEENIHNALQDVFTITPYFIGQTITINKLWKAIQSVSGIKRFTITYPTEDITCELNELLILNDSDININEIIPVSYGYR